MKIELKARAVLKSVVLLAASFVAGAAMADTRAGEPSADGPAAPRAKTEVMFFFDTEDFTCDRANDAIRDEAKILTEEGVRGHFAIVGYLADRLVHYGRRDVVEALKPHLIGTQSLYHSVHPNIMEKSDIADYAAAYRAVRADEAKGLDLIRKLTGRDDLLCAVPPGASKSYVAMYAYADLGIPFYCDTVADDRKGGDYSYCNIRHIPYSHTFMPETMMPAKCPGEPDYAAALDAIATERRAILFMHPNMALYAEFWDAVNYNRTNLVAFGRWKPSRPVPPEETAEYYRRLRRLIRALKADPRFVFTDLEKIKAEELPRTPIRPSDVPRLRRELARELKSIDRPSWSVADVFLAAVAFLRGESEYRPGKVYGFLEKPVGIAAATTVVRDDVIAAARTVKTDGFLPTAIKVGSATLGPADFLMAMLAVLDGEQTVRLAPRDQLGDLSRLPPLKNFSPRGSWIYTPEYEDRYTSDRLRWQFWTLRRIETPDSTGGTRPLRYFNVIPVRAGHVDFAVSEAKRQTALGVNEFAACLSYHPQTLPPENMLPKHAAAFRAFKTGLQPATPNSQPPAPKVGVLIQSTQGHSARAADVPWQRTVLASGKTHHRFCMLDPAFRAYVLEAIRSICREKPAFLLIDDDFGPRYGEGFCPLHADLYNRATGETRDGAAWAAFVKDAPADDPVRRKVEAARIRVPVDFAREIRAAIDSVDPTIRCGSCTPWPGEQYEQDVALALAGPNTRPFQRINNAVYGRQSPSCLLGQQRNVRRRCALFSKVGELVAEDDTWPQNYWSESARMFGAHLVLDILYGLDGGKLWMSEFDRTRDAGSQARYERVFKDELPKRQALYDLMRTARPQFHGLTAFVNVPERMSDSVKLEGPDYPSGLEEVFAPMGFPCNYAKAGLRHPHDVYLLVKNSVDLLSDAELAAVLSHRAFVDSQAAKELVRRGFGADLCATVSDYAPDEIFNGEVFADGEEVRWQSDATNVRLEAAKGGRALSRYVYVDAAAGTRVERGAGLTLGTNARGGSVMVAGWTYDCQGWERWNKYLRPNRKDRLVKAIDLLAGGVLPYTCVANNHAQCSYATLADGSDLVVVTNLGGDDWENLVLRRGTLPARAELLQNDGSWKPLAVEKKGDAVVFGTGIVRPLEPQILRVQ